MHSEISMCVLFGYMFRRNFESNQGNFSQLSISRNSAGKALRRSDSFNGSCLIYYLLREL